MLSLLRDTVEREDLSRCYTPVVTPVAPALGRAFDEACRVATARSIEDLRLATVALVQRLKADDVAPERVVVAIKAALTRYGGCRVPPSLYGDGEEEIADERHAVMYQRVFTWWLDAYYGTA